MQDDFDGSNYVLRFLGDPIRYLKTPPQGWEDWAEEDAKRAGWDGPGWYFWDETWCTLHGPFSTFKECRAALKAYAETL